MLTKTLVRAYGMHTRLWAELYRPNLIITLLGSTAVSLPGQVWLLQQWWHQDVTEAIVESSEWQAGQTLPARHRQRRYCTEISVFVNPELENTMHLKHQILLRLNMLLSDDIIVFSGFTKDSQKQVQVYRQKVRYVPSQETSAISKAKYQWVFIYIEYLPGHINQKLHG